ncbi:MAG: YceI family protein [Cyclobacteriaceae bacterium]|nr:YceI family protein [Cyclobacteriaceae bacterium HetDA_MAG_MS6]
MRIILFAMGLTLSMTIYAQKFLSESSYVHFYSKAPVEDIEAENKDGKSVLDIGTGEFAFTVPITSFEFEKSLMQEHFNENYLESEKYPNATFKGKIKDWKNQQGKAKVVAAGEFYIHGRTQEVEIPADIDLSSDGVSVEAKFQVVLQDYKIKIPKALFYNIAEKVDVTVKFQYKPYETN